MSVPVERLIPTIHILVVVVVVTWDAFRFMAQANKVPVCLSCSLFLRVFRVALPTQAKDVPSGFLRLHLLVMMLVVIDLVETLSSSGGFILVVNLDFLGELFCRQSGIAGENFGIRTWNFIWFLGNTRNEVGHRFNFDFKAQTLVGCITPGNDA